MYYYKVESCDYDNYEVVYLMHEELFTQNEFEDIFKRCLLKAAHNLPLYDYDFWYKRNSVRYESVIEDAADLMCRDYGFEYLKIEANYEESGPSPINRPLPDYEEWKARGK